VLSPGPCTPRESGVSVDIVRELGPDVPILGVCLGHQAIAYALGGRILRASEPMHGRTSLVTHNQGSLFRDLPHALMATRHHSLIVDEDSLPPVLTITARSADGAIMGLEHRQWPVVGVQFHPESVLTIGGHTLLGNFLSLAGIDWQHPRGNDFHPEQPADDFFSQAVLRDHPYPEGYAEPEVQAPLDHRSQNAMP